LETYRLTFCAMRTDFEFVLCGGRASRLAVAAEEARAEIETAERELSAFSLGSMLSRINREAGRRPVKAPGRLIELLQLCREVHRQSGGAFDPSVAPLMSAWGFRGAPAEDIAASLPAVGLDGLELDPVAGTVRFRRAGMELDLGGVGKGAALDRAAEALRELGVERALLHGGASTFLAVGAPPGQAAWRVGVRDPGHPERSLASIELRDRALSVSGQHGRTILAGGERRGHVLDPARGEPAAGHLAVVTASSAAAAAAWSPALLAGADRPVSWKACA